MRGMDNKLYFRMIVTDANQKGDRWELDDTIDAADVTSISCGKEGQFAFV